MEFERLYGSEEKCREALFSWRLPAFPRSRPPNANLRSPAPISTASLQPFASLWSSSMRSCASSRRRVHFIEFFSVKPEELIGRYLLAAGDHLNVPALREFLVSIQARGTTITDQDVEMELPGLGRRAFSMSARVLREDPSARRKILVAIVDATEVKREGKALEVAKSEAERANIGKSRFLAAASHDLRDGCKRPGVTRAEA